MCNYGSEGRNANAVLRDLLLVLVVTSMTEAPWQDDRLGTLLRGWIGIDLRDCTLKAACMSKETSKRFFLKFHFWVCECSVQVKLTICLRLRLTGGIYPHRVITGQGSISFHHISFCRFRNLILSEVCNMICSSSKF